MTHPSTTWKEHVPEGEAALHEQLAAELGALQQRLAARHGPKRALHAKANLVARAKVEVPDGLPQTHRVGLFATPRSFDGVVRFSNGGATALPDQKPDVRGLALKVLGVDGPKCIPGFEHQTQDFLAILTPTMPFALPEDFLFIVHAAQRPLTLVPKAIGRFGFGRALKLLGTLQKGLATPVAKLHTNRYFSPLPIRFGPYAAKYCFTPVGVERTLTRTNDLGAEFAQHLAAHAVQFHLQVQLFVDEHATPIEDCTVEWTSPWTTVATVTLPAQTIDASFATWAEALSFDPWHAQDVLRPLGAMMRARNAAYRVSTRNRQAAGEPTELP